MDRTSVNTQSWIAFRFQFYMALITRCNIWRQLNALSPFTDAAPCVSHRYDAGKNSAASTPVTDASPSAPVAPVCSHMQGGRIPVAQAGWWWRKNAAQAA